MKLKMENFAIEMEKMQQIFQKVQNQSKIRIYS